MVKYIHEHIQRWRYLGYDRETVQRYHAETDRANFNTIKRMCLLALVLNALIFLFYGVLLRQTGRVMIVTIFAVFLTIVYIYVTRLISSVSYGAIRGAKSLVFLISVVMYLYAILNDLMLSKSEIGALSIWMFLLVQISFDIPPVQNALTVIPLAVLSLVAGRYLKPLERWQSEVIYTTVSVVVGLYISHHQAKLALDNIIAQSNLQKANFALYHTATTDELTGLMNRRMLFDRYDAILNDCIGSKKSVACVVLDIDDYKQYNDKYGHPEGDELLRRIGSILQDYSKEHAIEIGRIGGEEFLAIWPEEDVARCERVAEELRHSIEHMAIPHSATNYEKVTMSVGLCLLPSGMAQGAYLYADKALYRAKDAGKNCACRYDPLTCRFFKVCAKSDSQQSFDRKYHLDKGPT